MTSSSVSYQRRPEEGRVVGVVGDVYRFLAVGEETAGRYATWEATVPPGGGPPPHIHTREEETFYVLEGEIEFHVDGERIRAAAGTFVHTPIGTLHAFKNVGEQTARMLISVMPAGLEQMFFQIGQPLAPGVRTAPPPTPDDIESLLAVAHLYGIEVQAPHHE